MADLDLTYNLINWDLAALLEYTTNHCLSQNIIETKFILYGHVVRSKSN